MRSGAGEAIMAVLLANRKCFILLTTAATTTLLLMLLNKPSPPVSNEALLVFEKPRQGPNQDESPSNEWKQRLTPEEVNNLSVLGRILFLEEEPPSIQDTGKKYHILVWKYGSTIDNRHMKSFSTQRIDPFEDCSVRNCEVTYSDDALTTADLVIFHLHRMKNGDLPERGSESQIWAFLTDESPYHTFMNRNDLKNYNGVFNWSMTYRMDSDIPVPYGRTVPRRNPLDENLSVTKRRDVLVAILGSNCGGSNKRWDYVRELQKHITVDVYGGCGTLKTCPGHFRSDCHDIDQYLFYLSFENSNCDEYVTEKLWWNAYSKNSIPIVMGGSKESYKKLLPPKSYLNTEDYATPKDLATHIKYLNSTGRFRDYYSWENQFEILNEHGYFQSRSYHYCRACEALNYNTQNLKVYKDLKEFWSVDRDCHPAWNAWLNS